MAFSRKALKARAAVRKQGAGWGYRAILRQGELAYFGGKTESDNPYPADSEDSEIWLDGWQGAHHDNM